MNKPAHDIEKDLQEPCKSCVNLDYWDGYFCSKIKDNKGNINYEIINASKERCEEYEKRIPNSNDTCSATKDDKCSFWCCYCPFFINKF